MVSRHYAVGTRVCGAIPRRNGPDRTSAAQVPAHASRLPLADLVRKPDVEGGVTP
jgi:hypothetical protein